MLPALSVHQLAVIDRIARKRIAYKKWRMSHLLQERLRVKKWRTTHRKQINEYERKYWIKHRDVLLPRHKKWHQVHRVIIQKKDRRYYLKHRKRIIARQSHYYATNINAWLSLRLRGRIRDAIKHELKSGSAIRDLGCSVAELKQRFEQQFVFGMNWNNHGHGSGKWHIDHIRPLSSFDLTDRTQFLQACHYTNLQPLWASENLRKGDALISPSTTRP